MHVYIYSAHTVIVNQVTIGKYSFVYSKSQYQSIDNMSDGTKILFLMLYNIFIVKNGQFLTPSLDKAGVAGVIRGKILDICKASGLAYLVTSLSLQDVLNADEVFLCNSIAGVWPVVRIADAAFETGSYTQKLQKQLASENMIVMS